MNAAILGLVMVGEMGKETWQDICENANILQIACVGRVRDACEIIFYSLQIYVKLIPDQFPFAPLQ